MKILYSLILAAMEVLLAFTISRTMEKAKKNLPLAKKARAMLASAFCAVLPNILIAMISPSWAYAEQLVSFLFFFYFASIDILLFNLLYFCTEYSFPYGTAEKNFFTAFVTFFKEDLFKLSKPKEQKTTWFEKCMIALFGILLADIVNLTSNFFTEAVFKIERFYYSSPFFEPDVFFRSVPGWSFDLHLALCYLTIALSLCCLLYKTIVASSLYKIKYISVILQVAIIVIINGFYVFFELPVDFSVLFYSVFSASFYYFSFNYIPSLLRRFTVHHVIQEMNNGIAIFDDRGQCIYANDYVREIYRIKPHQNPNDIIQPVIKRITNGRSLESIGSKEETIHRVVDEKEFFYKMTFSNIESKDKKYIGTYLTILDTTEENNHEKLERFRNTHDALTGLYNKQYFYDRVADMLEANPDEKYFIVCCDIGKFKLINEFSGIAVGDKILKSMAATLKEKTVIGEGGCRHKAISPTGGP